MGSLFRSEEMTLAQLFLPSDSAYACTRELGELGMVQFRDLNPDVNAFQRKFTAEVRRCDEMERRLRYLFSQLEKNKMETTPSEDVSAPDSQDMIDMESKFEVLEREVREIAANEETIKKNLQDLTELKHVLYKTRDFLQEAEYNTLLGVNAVVVQSPAGDDSLGLEIDVQQQMDLIHPMVQEEGDEQNSNGNFLSTAARFNFLTGVISRQKVAKFERVLWRACRGNVFLKQADIEERLEDPSTGEMQDKVVFILFFQGQQLHARVKKICDGFQATLYQCSDTRAEQDHMIQQVDQRISELELVIGTTRDHTHTQLAQTALQIQTWQTKVKKMKGIYHTLNMFNLDVTQRCLIAECWCPVEALDSIRETLNTGAERCGSTVTPILNTIATKETPPTYNKVNKFTRAFQAIVDAYGVATYQEVNPAPYTIITFPFLFAVMFGDAGHGLLMALFAITLILFEKKLEKTPVGGEMFMTMYSGRYIILLMGLFSIYTGLIYNDVFSKSINVFGSSWNAAYTGASLDIQTTDIGDCCPGHNISCVIMGSTQTNLITAFPREAMTNRQPYPFGIDPIWNVAGNKLIFTNSYKMKQAIILGIIQMLFGVILSAFNHVHFKRYANLFLEFIPQVLFLMCLFGWLVFLIVFKWSSFYEDPNKAPSLLITLINMFLEFGSSPKVSLNATSSGDNEYSAFGPSVNAAKGQNYFQVLLVIVALACVPWMLCIKPFYLCYKHRRNTKKLGGNVYYNMVAASDEQLDEDMKEEDEKIINSSPEDPEEIKENKTGKEEFELGEVFVYQAIHTIEYCLSTISNTASYLRLWALSLAHAQLSEVLWTMGLREAIGVAMSYGTVMGSLAMFSIFAFWAVETVVILLVMEGLSAFLHALRLHWVEFQTKFYDGNGYKFTPFSFDAILKNEDNDG